MTIRIRKINSIYVLVIIYLLFSTFLTLTKAASLEVMMLLLWIGASTVFTLYKLKFIDSANARNVITIGYFCRVVVIIFEALDGIRIENILRLGDSFAFVEQAVQFYHRNFVSTSTKYPFYLSSLFYLFGESRLLIQLVNVVLATLAICNVYKILAYTGVSRKLSLTAVTVLSFAPFFAVYNVVILREALYIFLLTYSFYYYVKWIFEGYIGDYILSCLCVFLTAVLHDGYLIVLAVYLVAFFLDEKNRNRRGMLLKGIVMVAVVAMVPFLFVNGRIGYLQFGSLKSIMESIGYVLAIHNDAGGNTAYLQSMQYTGTIWQTIFYTPIRILYFFISPIPWECRRVIDFLSFLGDSVLHLWFLSQTVKLFFRTKNVCFGKSEIYKNIDKVILTFITVVYAMGLVFAWGTTTAGTAMRHRSSILCIEVALATMIKYRCRTRHI